MNDVLDRFSGCDALPVSLSGALRLLLDDERGDTVTPVRFYAHHLLTGISEGTFHDLFPSIERLVLIQLDSVALWHHQRVHPVIAQTTVDQVFDFIMRTVFNGFRVPVVATHASLATTVFKESDGSNLSWIIRSHDQQRGFILKIVNFLVSHVPSTAV